MVQKERCHNCNGELEPIGNGQYRCKSCRSVFDETTTTDEEKLLLTAASKLLRDGEFDEADNSFRDITSSYPRNYEAYFGRALCKHGIIFVHDTIENKMVPTCYITDVGSFIDDSNYKRAVEFAPEEIKKDYIAKAEKIERIIDEWKNKAVKQSFDIFISFKDSFNDQRTDDSVEAQNLYTHLIQLGYKVFFSRETLRELVSERYEPYIFNAINVAPIMIVYGQKGEYLESTWVRNEWSRFIKKIQSGEKDRGGLIVCYEKMPASDLPKEFKSIQCMDASRKEFYGDLEAHITKVLEKVRKPVSGIETIQTEYGKVGKKATKLNYSEVKMNSLGTATVEKINETDEFILESAKKYFDHKMYAECKTKLDQFFEHNEYNYDANLLKLLVEKEVPTLEEYIAQLSEKSEVKKVKYLTTLTNKDEALKIINLLYEKLKDSWKNEAKIWIDIFKSLADLDFPQNKEMRYNAVNYVVDSKKYRNLFDELICYVDNNDINFHIQSRICLIKKCFQDPSEIDPKKYVDELAEIDEGNIDNLDFKILLDFGCYNIKDLAWKIINEQDKFFALLENRLKYTSEEDVPRTIESYFNEAIHIVFISDDVNETASAMALADRLIRYIPEKNKKAVAKLLEKLCSVLYEKHYYDGCIDYCNILMNYTEKRDDTLFLILFCKAKCPNYSKKGEIKRCNQKINTFDEWNLLIASTNPETEAKVFELYNEQIESDKYKENILKEKAVIDTELNKKGTGLRDKERKSIQKIKGRYALKYIFSFLLIFVIFASVAFGFLSWNLRNEKLARIFVNIYCGFTLIFFNIVFGKFIKKRSRKAFKVLLPFLIAIPVIAAQGQIPLMAEELVEMSFKITNILIFVTNIIWAFGSSLLAYDSIESWYYWKIQNRDKKISGTLKGKTERIDKINQYFEEEKTQEINDNLCKEKYDKIRELKAKLEETSHE